MGMWDNKDRKSGKGWMSGFCCVGHCEGTNPKGALSGTPMQTCTFADSCTCNCHATITKMFEMTGLERTVQQNPSYVPVERTWQLPSVEERLAMRSRKTETAVPTIVASPVPDVLPPDAVVEFAPTESGRRPKGELEDRVKKVTDAWTGMASLGGKMRDCTPAWIAEQIDEENPPSTGAITAVFDRWVAYGFATVEKKPTRFTGYTPEGVKKGLYTMKAEYSHNKRRTAVASSKGR
jgi:hypothetical protein